MIVRFGQASAKRSSAARSRLSTLSRHRCFTAVHTSMYRQRFAGGIHCSGPDARLDWFSAAGMALSA